MKKCENCIFFTSRASVAGICKKTNQIVMKNSVCDKYKDKEIKKDVDPIIGQYKKYSKIIIRNGEKFFID